MNGSRITELVYLAFILAAGPLVALPQDRLVTLFGFALMAIFTGLHACGRNPLKRIWIGPDYAEMEREVRAIDAVLGTLKGEVYAHASRRRQRLLELMERCRETGTPYDAWPRIHRG